MWTVIAPWQRASSYPRAITAFLGVPNVEETDGGKGRTKTLGTDQFCFVYNMSHELFQQACWPLLRGFQGTSTTPTPLMPIEPLYIVSLKDTDPEWRPHNHKSKSGLHRPSTDQEWQTNPCSRTTSWVLVLILFLTGTSYRALGKLLPGVSVFPSMQRGYYSQPGLVTLGQLWGS